MNFLLRTDSYKFTHWKQYPPKTTRIYSYLESRGGMFPNTVFFGLQYYLKAYLEGPRFTQADIAQADEFCRQHFGSALFNREGSGSRKVRMMVFFKVFTKTQEPKLIEDEWDTFSSEGGIAIGYL